MLTNVHSFDIISLVPNGQAPIAQLDRAFDYESKGHRFESCWVHHEPPTSFALLVVVFYSFVFLGIVTFLKSCSRIQASVMEAWVWDFLLCWYSIISGSFWRKTCLSQKVSQTESNNSCPTLVTYRFFELHCCHKNCHKAVKLPAIRSQSIPPIDNTGFSHYNT